VRRRDASGQLEDRTDFLTRKMCGKSCPGSTTPTTPATKTPTSTPATTTNDDGPHLEGDGYHGYEPESAALPTATGALEISRDGKLVVVIDCDACHGQHTFPWRVEAGVAGTAGLRQLCPARGK
jgi:hypothetical protein